MLEVVEEDLLDQDVHAIVLPVDSSYAGDNDLVKRAHEDAGEELDRKLATLDAGKPGQAVITWGYDADFVYLIHAVVPEWKGGDQGEEGTLRTCYQNCLGLALTHECRSAAFPVLGLTTGFPEELAKGIAEEELKKFADEHTDRELYLCT